MTFLAPGFLYASLAAAAAIIALHFIVLRQPRSSTLPTARFVPDTRATTVATARKPADLPLMLLRVIAMLAAGAALAKPVIQAARRARASVILVDVSRSIGDSLALRDSMRSVYRDGDAVVLFDSSARLLAANHDDSVGMLRPSGARGNLSAAFVMALRAGSVMRERADSIQLVVVSAFANEEFDAATDSIRSLWRGNARLVRMGAVPGQNFRAASPVGTNALADDPLATTIALLGSRAADGVFLNRSGSQHAPNASGVLVDWRSGSVPLGAVARGGIDTIGGVTAGDAIVIAPFARRWTYSRDSLSGAEVVARWIDGEPAAIEKPGSGGCVRSVAIPVTPVGDLSIRKDFVALVQNLSRPCAKDVASVTTGLARSTRLAGGSGLAPRTAFRARANLQSPFTPSLLVVALLSAIAELLLRRRTKRIPDESSAGVSRARAA